MKVTDIIAATILVLGAGAAIEFVVMPAIEKDRERQAASVAVERAEPMATPVAAVASDRTGAAITKAAILRKENDGHFWATANADGTSVKFMVDTGASTVALTYKDAQRMGVTPSPEDFRWRIRTAGGEVKGASVLIESIKIGMVEVENVEAMVLRDGLSQSLLGMTFLGELQSYEFRQSNLILRQ
ncbi:MAG: TIGR02281 family clan AA aspartic protease [Pseudomonadota bacterium]